PELVIQKITSHIRRVRPHVMITFDPNGGYGHPDHIAISQFTAAAIVCAADANYHVPENNCAHRVSILYYMVETAAVLAVYESIFGPLVMNIDGSERRSVSWHD